MKYSRTYRIAEYTEEMTPVHPMLKYAAGVVTIVAVCNTSANALALTVVMLILCVVNSFVYIFEKGEYIQPMRTVIYFIPSAVTVFWCGLFLLKFFPHTYANLGFYLPMLAADGLVLARLKHDARFVPVSQSLAEGISHWWLYAVCAMPTGMLRELLARGTVFSHKIPFIRVSAVNLPFAGFIMLGFSLAAVQFISNRKSK